MKLLLLLLLAVALLAVRTQGVILTPPYFNLAAGRRVYATATCGEEIQEPELYCKLVGANADRDVNINLIQGQVSCEKPLGVFQTANRSVIFKNKSKFNTSKLYSGRN